MTADQYNKAFTLHGAIMVFLVIIPSIPAALGNFVLPIMLGAKDVAFPKRVGRPDEFKNPADPVIANFLNPVIDLKNPRFKQLENAHE